MSYFFFGDFLNWLASSVVSFRSWLDLISFTFRCQTVSVVHLTLDFRCYAPYCVDFIRCIFLIYYFFVFDFLYFIFSSRTSDHVGIRRPPFRWQGTAKSLPESSVATKPFDKGVHLREVFSIKFLVGTMVSTVLVTNSFYMEF